MDHIERPSGAGDFPMCWVSDLAAEMLRRIGIKYVSLNPGASYRGFHDSLVNYLGNQDPQMLLCLHEDHAVSIAHGYAKVTGEPMACVLHSNVGLMHGTLGIFNAWCDRVPMIVMGATGPVDAPLRRPWIDWIHTAKDQGALVRNFTKWDDEPRSAQACVESMLRASIIARTAPRGPVYICLDATLQERELAEPVRIPDLARYAPADPPQPPPAALEAAADMLARARKPVFLVGRVARRREDWDRRVRLAEILGAAVLTDLKTGATFPTDHRLHFESPGDFVTEGKRALLLKADVILSLDWIDLAGTFKQATGKDEVQGKVIQASVDSYNHNGWSMDHQGLPPADLLLLAEPDVAVARLLPLVEARMTGKSPKWEGGEPSSPAPEGAEGERGIALRDIAQTLERVRGDRDLSIVPVPRSGEGFRFDDPLDCLGLDGGAGLSSGPGLAVGAGLALKGSGRFPVAILGDGNFLQGATALWTAAHYEIPVLYLIENNHSNLNDEIHQETVAKQRGRPPENRWIGVRIDSPPPGLPDIARAQGVAADGPVAKLDDLAAAIEKGLRTVEEGRPYLVDVTVLPRSPRGKYWERG